MPSEIRQFIIKAIEKKSRLPLNCDLDSFNFVDSGHVDSIGIIRFILEVENEFGVEIEPEEIESPGFRTIGGLTAIIEGKLGTQGA